MALALLMPLIPSPSEDLLTRYCHLASQSLRLGRMSQGAPFAGGAPFSCLILLPLAAS
jgi:hypothetical protein